MLSKNFDSINPAPVAILAVADKARWRLYGLKAGGEEKNYENNLFTKKIHH